jgi:uncharacterized protein (DUF362 family)
VVGSLVALCREAGAASVRVVDFPFGGSYADAYKSSGVKTEVLAAGGEMVTLHERKFVEQSLPNAVALHSAAILEDATKADVLINVPIAKQHELSGLTIGMKNLMGVIQNRDMIHDNFEEKLGDLAAHIKTTLTVVDAVRILTANGPTGGSLSDVKKLDTIIASADIVAADAYATTLFGLDAAKDIPYIQRAAERGIGRMDLANLDIQEIKVG